MCLFHVVVNWKSLQRVTYIPRTALYFLKSGRLAGRLIAGLIFNRNLYFIECCWCPLYCIAAVSVPVMMILAWGNSRLKLTEETFQQRKFKVLEMLHLRLLKFRYCEKAQKFENISPHFLSLFKSKQSAIFFQICVDFSEYLNFNSTYEDL